MLNNKREKKEHLESCYLANEETGMRVAQKSLLKNLISGALFVLKRALMVS